ncbi:2OG-Fe(II) oxygenase family protein [Marinobacterium aestuariivivens]|uniref:2OG-Fe(II) oxygenase family protein n=1 Tax=Marinobacterium aestuariivivens TaxID=1698799 RepID=A0ABW2A4Z9_9GAMM
MQSTRYSLFPTLIWESRLQADLVRMINRLILEQMQELRRTLPSLTAGESWQSGNRMQDATALQPLLQVLDIAAKDMLRALRIGQDDLRVTGCWLNLNARGAGHRMHSHPNNFLSGVYYVRTGEGADTINFHDPRVQAGVIKPPVTELAAGNTDQVVLRVEEGMLLLFPSWLQHSVDPNRGDIERVSVSFNLMFASYVDSMSPPLW